MPPGHVVEPAAQTHEAVVPEAEAVQVSPLLHALPHAPQLAGSVIDTHLPPQSCCPVGQ